MPTAYDRFLEATSYEEFVKATFEALTKEYPGNVFQRRKYRGKRSGHDHEIDVAIEISLADLEFLILVECKHYKRTVEVGEILEFAQRIDDIGAHKGVLVSTIGFQEGTIKVAEAHKIALITTAPVWRTVSRSVDKDGNVLGMFIAPPHVGGYGDQFLGVTIVCQQLGIIDTPSFLEAWVSVTRGLVKHGE